MSYSSYRENGDTYRKVDVRGLKEMRCNHIIEAATCAWDLLIRDLIGFLLETLDCRSVFDALLLSQRAPAIFHIRSRTSKFP